MTSEITNENVIPRTLILDTMIEVKCLNDELHKHAIHDIEVDIVSENIIAAIYQDEFAEVRIIDFIDVLLQDYQDVYCDGDRLYFVNIALMNFANRVLMKVRCLGLYVNKCLPYEFVTLTYNKEFILERSQ